MQRDELLRNELLAEVESIAPIVAEHAPHSEKLGRLDDPTFEAMRSTRLLRILCPRELGGLEVDPVTQVEILEALARIDASASWVLGILNGSAIAAFLPAASARKILANGIPTMAGVLGPKGQAEPVKGGYRVKGRWAFGSGIHHAEWAMAAAFVLGQPPPAGLRVVVVPREQVVIHDNWQVAGSEGIRQLRLQHRGRICSGRDDFPFDKLGPRQPGYGWCRFQARASSVRRALPYRHCARNRPSTRWTRSRRRL